MKTVWMILGGLFLANVLAWLAVGDLAQGNFLEVTFFDVGQGDSIFIETPQNQQILIDGGPDDSVIEKLGKEMPFWDRTIDLIILTHPEKDHLTGLLEVLKRYEVQNILWTGIVRDTAEFKEWEKLIVQEGAQIFIAQAGQKIYGGRNSRRSFDLLVLHPFENLEGKEVKDSNNTSMIIRLVYGEKSFLFTGDAYQAVEKELIKRGVEIDSDVLKVAHHGSKTSSAEEFIKAVSPEIAVISAGKGNSYGHPHAETLAILEKYDIRILNTSYGYIKILCNSQSLKLKSED